MAFGSAGFFSPEGLQGRKAEGTEEEPVVTRETEKGRGKEGRAVPLASPHPKGPYSCSRGCGECLWNQEPA